MNVLHTARCLVFLVATLALSGSGAFSPWVEAAETIDIGSRLELFIDDELIDSLDGARLELHHPRLEGPAIRFDRPWEGRFCGYVTVLRDGDLYRMYYRGLPKAGGDGRPIESTCYAESDDGVNWRKPELGLFEVDGSTDNNVVLKGFTPASHNFSPFVDGNPEAAANARYKALGGTSPKGLIAFGSADGLRWRKLAEAPVITQGAFDSQNVSFWSDAEQLYVCYLRTWSGPGEWTGFRSVSRSTSKDFLDWSQPEPMTFGDTPPEHLYTNQTQPYFRAPHIYLGIAARFWPGRRVLTEDQAREIRVDPKYFGDISDSVLLSSRGGTRYTRTFLESLVRPGQGLENWVSRTNYPALGLVPIDDSRMALWIQKNYGQPDARLDRYSLRTDGFISVHGPYAGGEMRTRLMRFGAAPAEETKERRRVWDLREKRAASRRFPEQELVLNFATSAAGSVRVEIQDESGKAIPGRAFEDCPEMIGDWIARPVRWKGGTDVSTLRGRPLRLRFVLKDADVWSLRFR